MVEGEAEVGDAEHGDRGSGLFFYFKRWDGGFWVG
jgi:hypothetical protein